MKLHKALNRMREMHEAYDHARREDNKQLTAWRDEVIQLREQNRVLRSNLVNCAARLEAYYGEDYPAVRDAKAALDGGKGVQGEE